MVTMKTPKNENATVSSQLKFLMSFIVISCAGHLPIEQIIQHQIAAYFNLTQKISQFEFRLLNRDADCFCNQITFFALKLILRPNKVIVVLR